MKIILQSDVNNLGQTGDIVRVKPGYARNYLIPRGFAIIADERNLAQLNHQQRMAQIKFQKEHKAATELAEQISSSGLNFERESGEDGKLFGSVTNRDIAEALQAQEIVVDRRKIKIADAIKSVGSYSVEIDLGCGVSANLTVVVGE